MDKSLGRHYQLVAITLGIILVGGAFLGTIPIVFADDDDDKKKKLKQLKDLLKKLRDRHRDDDRDDDEKKVLVCHIPPGNPEKRVNIWVSKNSVQTHLDHGDFLGKCDKYGDVRDKKDPKIDITFPNKNQEVEGPTVMITGTASDELSGIKEVLVRIDNGDYEDADYDEDTETWKFTTGVLSEGKHKVTAKAIDNADNSKRDSVNFKVVSSSGENELNIRIDSRSDDAEQKNNKVKTTSNDLDLNQEDLVGLRFNDIDIPKGSTISNAFVVFTVEDKKGDSGKAVVKIFAQDSNDASTFSKSNNNISNRPMTDASVEWDIPKWNKRGDDGAAQTTPNISDLIQEVIERDGWSEGNSIVIIFEKHEGSNDRDAVSYDKSRKDAARLHVEFNN